VILAIAIVAALVAAYFKVVASRADALDDGEE